MVEDDNETAMAKEQGKRKVNFTGITEIGQEKGKSTEETRCMGENVHSDYVTKSGW